MASDVITEKVYCNGPNCGYGYGGDAMTAALLNNNNWSNNPFGMILAMGCMRMMFGDDWRQRYGSDPEITARFNQLSGQISDNHNTDMLSDLARGNYARIGELANQLGIDHRAIQGGICDLRAAVQQVSGDTRFSAERVINAAERGDTQIIAALKDCCCQNKELVLTQGYEGRLAQKDLQSALQGGHAALGYQMQQGFDRTNTGLERGFSSVAYEAQRQTCDIVNAVNAAQQRTADLLNAHWKDELSQALQDARGEISQLKQTQQILDAVKKSTCNCCGCGS